VSDFDALIGADRQLLKVLHRLCVAIVLAKNLQESSGGYKGD
jgi:hypothetical protein